MCHIWTGEGVKEEFKRDQSMLEDFERYQSAEGEFERDQCGRVI